MGAKVEPRRCPSLFGGAWHLVEERGMAGRVLFVELGLDATNEDILDQMRVMKKARMDRAYDSVVCSIRGFADDPRELFEIPEVRAFCRRIINLGLISYWMFRRFSTPTCPS